VIASGDDNLGSITPDWPRSDDRNDPYADAMAFGDDERGACWPSLSPKRTPWNKSNLIGPKPPLTPKHVWSIRTQLQIERRTRDLALFNLAIDSKLRGCDVVALKVEDVAPAGYTVDRATVRQKKTGRAVRFELTEQTRQAIDDYVRTAVKKPGEFLFSGRVVQNGA
jgi:hypothetical protein